MYHLYVCTKIEPSLGTGVLQRGVNRERGGVLNPAAQFCPALRPISVPQLYSLRAALRLRAQITTTQLLAGAMAWENKPRLKKLTSGLGDSVAINHVALGLAADSGGAVQQSTASMVASSLSESFVRSKSRKINQDFLARLKAAEARDDTDAANVQKQQELRNMAPPPVQEEPAARHSVSFTCGTRSPRDDDMDGSFHIRSVGSVSVLAAAGPDPHQQDDAPRRGRRRRSRSSHHGHEGGGHHQVRSHGQENDYHHERRRRGSDEQRHERRHSQHHGDEQRHERRHSQHHGEGGRGHERRRRRSRGHD